MSRQLLCAARCACHYDLATACMHVPRLQQALLAPQARGRVPAAWLPQVASNTRAGAQANWAALWAVVGRSDTALVLPHD